MAYGRLLLVKPAKECSVMLKNFYLSLMMIGLTACDPEAPTISLESGTYNENQLLVISTEEEVDDDEEIKIYYTLNGDTPTVESTLYVGPIDLVGPEASYAVRAIATYKNYESDISAADIQILLPSEPPTIDLPGGIYEGDQLISFSHSDSEATIYYTLDGSIPSESSTVYDGAPVPISVESGSVTVQAIAIQGSRPSSSLVSSEIILFEDGLSPSSVSFQFDHLAEVAAKQVLLGNFTEEVLSYEVDKIRITNKESVTDPRILGFSAASSTRKKKTDIPDFSKDLVVPGEIIVRMMLPQNELAFASKLKSLPVAETILAGQVSYKIIESELLSQLSYNKSIKNSKNIANSQESADVIVKISIDSKNPGDLITAIEELQKLPEVLYAEPNHVIKLNQVVPNDAMFGDLYGLENTGQDGGLVGADISATEAWSIHQGNPLVTIGVIDTGVDYTHPDLIGNIWTNPGEIADNGIDDDGNGYVDDVHGYDFYNNDGDPMDDQGHGTHVSGTIAATGNNEIGVVGVMWQAKIVGIKFLSSTGGGTIAGAISAVEYANTLGLPITSNSWGGGGFSQALKDVIEAGDSLFVAAAGNNNSNTDSSAHYPSGFDSPNVVSVAASDNLDNRAYFSNYGATSVDLAAPGLDIMSTYPNNGYASFSGTSMATPHVSGLAGLVLGYSPSLAPSEIKQILLESVDPLAAFEGISVTGGRINAEKALKSLDVSWLSVTTDSDSLLPGEYGTINIAIVPPEERSEIEAGTYSLELTLLTSDLDEPIKTVDITVIVNPCRNISFADTVVDFGQVKTGDSSVVVITATNSCNAPVLAEGFALESDFGTFQLDGPWQFVVPAFSTSSRSLVFNSSGYYDLGDFSLPVSISTTSDDGDAFGFTYEGRTGNGAVLSITPTPLAITVPSGELASAPFEISNSGDLILSYEFMSSSSMLMKTVETDVPESDFPWQDISATGQRLSISSYDDRYEEVEFGMDFPFDEAVYSSAYISTNGLVGLSGGTSTLVNRALPTSYIPSDSILTFWDDLNPSSRGDIYVQGDESQFIIQYQDVTRFADSATSLTFQLKLNDNGFFQILYDNMQGTLTSSTIGYQGASGDFDQAAYNESFIQGKTILSYSPFTAFAEPSSGMVGMGESQMGEVTVDATGIDPGYYEIGLNIGGNSLEGIVVLNIQVTVI